MTDSSPDRNDNSRPAKGPVSDAERQRCWRRRKEARKRSTRADYTEEWLAGLESDGWITADDLDDPEKLGAAIEDRDDCQKRGIFHPGPIVTGAATN